MTLMYFVDLFELDAQAKQKKIATFKMGEDDPNVEIDGDQYHPAIENLKGEGIFDYKNASLNKLYPYDGLSFLENLKYNFRSGYLSASEVQKKRID